MSDNVSQTEAPRGWRALACRAEDGTEWTWEDGCWYIGKGWPDADGCSPHRTDADLKAAHGYLTVTEVDNVSALWVDWHRDHQLWAAEVRARALAPRDEAKDAKESALWDHCRSLVDAVKAEHAQADADLRAQIVEALDYEDDDRRPLPDLVAALIAEYCAADARTMATRQMSIDADARTRTQLLAALGREDDGRTTRDEYVDALIGERDFARNETKSVYDTAKVLERERDTFREVAQSNKRHVAYQTEYCEQVEAQRDAARAVVAAVRALHSPVPGWEREWADPAEALAQGWPRCAGCQTAATYTEIGKCPTLVALDGTQPTEEQR